MGFPPFFLNISLKANQSDPLQRTLWFSFTGDGNAYCIRTVVGTATNYISDTQAALFSGDCAAPTFVNCNDDEDANNNILNVSMQFSTVAGTTYRLLVDGYERAQGQFCLEVTNLGVSSVIDIANTNIRLFPNPTTGIVQLTNVQPEQVLVYSSMGRLVQHLCPPAGMQEKMSAG